jgi:hypothetical protein
MLRRAAVQGKCQRRGGVGPRSLVGDPRLAYSVFSKQHRPAVTITTRPAYFCDRVCHVRSSANQRESALALGSEVHEAVELCIEVGLTCSARCTGDSQLGCAAPLYRAEQATPAREQEGGEARGVGVTREVSSTCHNVEM